MISKKLMMPYLTRFLLFTDIPTFACQHWELGRGKFSDRTVSLIFPNRSLSPVSAGRREQSPYRDNLPHRMSRYGRASRLPGSDFATFTAPSSQNAIINLTSKIRSGIVPRSSAREIDELGVGESMIEVLYCTKARPSDQ